MGMAARSVVEVGRRRRGCRSGSEGGDAADKVGDAKTRVRLVTILMLLRGPLVVGMGQRCSRRHRRTTLAMMKTDVADGDVDGELC